MARDLFEDLSRNFVLAFAPRFCESLRTSASCAALLDEAFQVASGQLEYFNYTLPACVHCELRIDSHAFQAQEAVADAVDTLLPEHSPHYQININCIKKIIWNRLSVRAMHCSPERTQCTTLGGLCLPC